jgi:SAM-dependent methyltransferase
MSNRDEIDAVRARYDRRNVDAITNLYDPFRTVNLLIRQEKEWAVNRLLARWLKGRMLADLRIAEVGCGSGVNLLHMISLGANPSNLIANELLQERLAAARNNLPSSVTFMPGDAASLTINDGSLDIVIQSTVFSSLLDSEFRKALAARMLQWLKPGGCVLWYDFTFNNPGNPDVRGVTLAEIRALFPGARITAKRVTLAPPLARRLGAAVPVAYPLLNLAPFLRTHLVCIIEKVLA